MEKNNVNPVIQKCVDANIGKVDILGQYSIILCADAFRLGGNWGFVKKEDENYKIIKNELKKDENISVKDVSNGALVMVKPDYLVEEINKIIPNALGQSFKAMSNSRKQKEQLLFQKFITNVIEGKNKSITKHDEFYDVVIGIYSINSVNVIKLNNKEYPAYKLTLKNALDFVSQIAAMHGKRVYVKRVREDGTRTFSELDLTASGDINSIYRGLDISDTETGIFMTLKIQA